MKKFSVANEVSKNTNTPTTTLNNEVVKVTTDSAVEVLHEVKKDFYTALLNESVAFDATQPKGKQFTLSESKHFGGMQGLQYLGYLITKSIIGSREYLPSVWQSQKNIPPIPYGNSDPTISRSETTYHGLTVVDCQEMAVSVILLAIKDGEKENAIGKAFKALSEALAPDNYGSRDAKTLPKEEILDIDFRQSVQDLCDLTPKGVDDYYGGDFTKAIYELFDKVKKAHKFATDKRWKCFEYFVLNVPNSQIAELLAISKQKASANNRQMVQWFVDEVNKLDTDSLIALGFDEVKLEKLNK